jgi:hypothetical protein
MATQSKNGKAKTATPKTQSTDTSAATSRAERVRTAAESAVDLPVGAVLEVTDRVTELVEPFTGRAGAEKQLKSYRSNLRRTLKRTERRGASARRKATSEARKTRGRVERAARKRRRTVEERIKRNRDEVEQRVRRAIDEQTSRAQDLVDQVGEQLSALR